MYLQENERERVLGEDLCADLADLDPDELETTPDEQTLDGIQYSDLPNPDEQVNQWAYTGWEFIYGDHFTSEPVWGMGSETLWQTGEAMMIVSDPGIGKTTLAQQIVEARIGLTDSFLGLPVKPSTKKVLYLACDRPAQIRRSFRRLLPAYRQDVTGDLARTLHDRLVVWSGPLPRSVVADTHILIKMAAHYKADTVVIDSVKDIVPRLTDDEAGITFNTAVQHCLRAGVEVLMLHHNRKNNGGHSSQLRDLASVYGSVWLTAGVGSVISLEGKQGNPRIRFKSVKNIADAFEFELMTDFRLGRHSRVVEFEPTAWLREKGSEGATVRQLACRMFCTSTPERAHRDKARHVLETMVRHSKAEKSEGKQGGAGGGTPSRYVYLEDSSTVDY